MRIFQIAFMIVAQFLSYSTWASDFLDIYNLKIGGTYQISRETPLMPQLNAPKSIEATLDSIQKMVKLQPGEDIEILNRVNKDQKYDVWYEVKIIKGNRKGWINSTALLGQKLSAR